MTAARLHPRFNDLPSPAAGFSSLRPPSPVPLPSATTPQAEGGRLFSSLAAWAVAGFVAWVAIRLVMP